MRLDNYTDDELERLSFHSGNELAQELALRYSRKDDEIADKEQEIEVLERDLEIKAEQVSFAQELVNKIREAFECHTTAKELRGEIKRLLG
ncbi:MAG: hypothetical protein FWF12_00230 [Betaproteobacteria bacterium]|nr:hypothetical protein [Betaproteobacteria bacterium]